MVRPKRNQQHPDLQTAIKEVAKKQISGHGAARLSLRGIARELGITAPAIYNYYPRRDDLVTTLIVDAYHSLAAALAEARDAEHVNHAESIMASARAYRGWALAHSAEYSLIFGTPIPNYHAPMEITSPAASESMMVLIQVIDAAYQDGELTINELPPALKTMLQPWSEKLGFNGPLNIIHLALASWVLIHGLVSLELFGHLAPGPEFGFGEVDSFFEAEIQAMLERMGIR